MTSTGKTVWVVDDDASIRQVLGHALAGVGLESRAFESATAALAAMAQERPAVLVTDLRMPDLGGLELLERVAERAPGLPVIVMTAYSDLDNTVAAYRGGAFEFLAKPFDLDDAVALVRRAIASPAGAGAPRSTPAIPGLIGQAPAMQAVYRTIGRLSASAMNVLITGESGTGKELVARALHEHSPRAAGPWIALNISAIPAELLEAELFGHEKGAFTGAEQARPGRFEQAHGGTLFLDEIGDMPQAMQTRLLRVLAEGEFYRLGGRTPVKVDVRVIAATHQDLDEAVAAGRFRSDLFHRLNVMHIRLPPLTDRREDIDALLDHYLDRAAAELGVPAKTLAPEVRRRLVAHDWPGNVRELVNVCRRMMVTAPGGEIHLEDLPGELASAEPGAGAAEWSRELARWARHALASGTIGLMEQAEAELGRRLIREALAHTGGHKQEAARLLGIGRNTLTRKLRELGIE